MGKDCAVIYGSLPPGTKLAMSERFNDPKHPCKIMVATDAIGMGLNLNIRRIIFYSLNKIHLLEDGNREMKVISVSQALQIAGRAGKSLKHFLSFCLFLLFLHKKWNNLVCPSQYHISNIH